ncbi:sulfotransferase 1A1-like [Ruditapes philippinarum]|uniref:sulfotransferase 1A1-like n=1 Tax=Ruditapes philippinarum TaxID=129788 RepID=UPI00295B9AD1|nr:sulfotransferase 1A1-like [Ruditapes philippinarum]
MSGIEVVDEGGEKVQLVDVDGYRVCNFERDPNEVAELVRGLKDRRCRPDDVFLLTPPKSGTHWVWEITCMLIQGRADTIPKSKSKNMLEHQTAEFLEKVESPRVLNSHLNIKHLPKQIFEDKLKTILVLRNPKDLVVSFYHHTKGIKCYGYNGKWEHFFKLFLNNELDYGSWFKYVKEWETYILEHSDHHIHVIFYEELHKNNVEEIKRLAKFLGLDPSEELVQAISEKCQFHNMYKDKMHPDSVRREIYNGDYTLYRKGKVGDWKNWFTVAQNEEFDKHYLKFAASCGMRFQFT